MTTPGIPLLPCPFCGSPARWSFYFHEEDAVIPEDRVLDSPLWDAACTDPDCYLASGANWTLRPEEVAKLWNRRPAPPDSEKSAEPLKI